MTLMRFRLKLGQHIAADTTQEPIVINYVDKYGRPQQQLKYPSKTYNIGDIVESEDDLALKHGEDKFQRLEPGTMRKPTRNDVLADTSSPQAVVPPGDHHSNEDNGPKVDDLNLQSQQDAALDEMTVQELRAFAEDNEIDLAGCRSKAEILNAVHEARKAR